MSDLAQALDIFEKKFGSVGNLKFLLAPGMEIDSVSADFLALARETVNGSLIQSDSFPEPDLFLAA